MEGKSSHGTSWPDQWDYNPEPVAVDAKHNGNSGRAAKYKQKVGEGLGKTKVVASNGIKKLKQGSTAGFNWIKTKYHNAITK